MAARKSSRVNRKYKTKHRVTNWREYERGLRSRGDITVWFSDEAREAWTPPNQRFGHAVPVPGRLRTNSGLHAGGTLRRRARASRVDPARFSRTRIDGLSDGM